MSLKARIEAVIYAAEEPVTLAQLASLFRDEALLSRAERTAPQPDPEAPTEDALPAEAIAVELTADTSASLLPDFPAPDSPVPDAPPVESLDSEVPPIPSAQEEPTTTAADPVSELADSTATESFPDGAPPPADSLADSASETREAPPAGREAPREATTAGSEVPEAPLDDEKKAARARDREVREEIRRLVDELIADYSAADRGLEIREVAGGFRLATRAEYHDAVRAFVKSLKPPMKLSLQALETLAVIAYKQPVTAPEIGEIRGVDSGGVLGSLVARKLITTAGRKQVIGRPILYKTTKEFLLRFGLKDLNELPSIEEFEKMATDLAESDLAESGLAEEPSPSQEEELPFAQNDIADVEENETAGVEQSPAPGGEGDSTSEPVAQGDSPSAQGPHDPKEPAPPMNEPPPENPEPPIGEPPTEPDQSPTTEYDAAEEHQS